jgi:hypothetical protein
LGIGCLLPWGMVIAGVAVDGLDALAAQVAGAIHVF